MLNNIEHTLVASTPVEVIQLYELGLCCKNKQASHWPTAAALLDNNRGTGKEAIT